MSYEPTTKLRSQRRVSPRRSSAESFGLLLMPALLCAAQASTAAAQSWSAPRTRPLLRQIVSVDATGESIWPYGTEDIAGDSLAMFADDEAEADLRSVYADADEKRVWLRAYVAAEQKPAATLTVFFFADTDDRNDTGGPAFAEPFSPGWITDPTPGGYERAIGVQTDGKIVGTFGWDSKDRIWVALNPEKDDVLVEVGLDEDPIRIGIRRHGYVQIDASHAFTGLTASCAGNLFVRTWQETEPMMRAFGDDDTEFYACRPPTDVYGDPTVIRSAECKVDADCPNDGRCRDEVCLFASPCDSDADCRTNQRCTAGACVRVVDESCVDNADCQGLVCESGACVACAETGARACAGNLSCSPDGTCVDPGDYVPGGVGDGGTPGSGNGGAGESDAGIVRGGAFRCAASPGSDRSSGIWLCCLAAGWLITRRARREGRAS